MKVYFDMVKCTSVVDLGDAKSNLSEEEFVKKINEHIGQVVKDFEMLPMIELLEISVSDVKCITKAEYDKIEHESEEDKR